jgi:hypothetical protein
MFLRPLSGLKLEIKTILAREAGFGLAARPYLF